MTDSNNKSSALLDGSSDQQQCENANNITSTAITSNRPHRCRSPSTAPLFEKLFRLPRISPPPPLPPTTRSHHIGFIVIASALLLLIAPVQCQQQSLPPMSLPSAAPSAFGFSTDSTPTLPMPSPATPSSSPLSMFGGATAVAAAAATSRPASGPQPSCENVRSLLELRGVHSAAMRLDGGSGDAANNGELLIFKLTMLCTLMAAENHRPACCVVDDLFAGCSDTMCVAMDFAGNWHRDTHTQVMVLSRSSGRCLFRSWMDVGAGLCASNPSVDFN